MNTGSVRIEDYNYSLPEERIAKFPLSGRDESNLLVYRQGEIKHHLFRTISDELNRDDLLISNNTRVIAARLFFKKKTGASIEVFCLEPVDISHERAMAQLAKSEWKCLVGGAKKWKGDEVIECEVQSEVANFIVRAKQLRREGDAFIIRFEWSPENLPFSEILHFAGELPLPPYFHRKAEKEDYERYQTVFAVNEGSVAAPTAGLHFTKNVLSELRANGIIEREVTLHVGAGTFKPVTSNTMENHVMHSESFVVPITLLGEILSAKGRIIPVGTTSMRTLESLYWIGVKLLSETFNPFEIGQWEAYHLPQHFSLKESLNALINHCQAQDDDFVRASTSILIAPGYDFKICNGLITNFHLPKSTLLLLVAAFIGSDWKKVYDYAMKNDFRFLSYGDSSLLWKS